MPGKVHVIASAKKGWATAMFVREAIQLANSSEIEKNKVAELDCFAHRPCCKKNVSLRSQ